MKPLMWVAGMGLALIAMPAAAQYGGGAMGGGYQTGVVDTPQSDDDAQIGVDDGSGIIQGETDIHRNKKKKKKVKDASCHEEKVNGYRVSNCW